MNRLLSHLLHAPRLAGRAFPPATQTRIRDAVATSEQRHTGELRVIIEGNWPLTDVWSGRTPQQRALDLFGLTRVWDTEHNCGVMIYALLAERHVEIIADRGINARVAPDCWSGICNQLTADFAAGQFESGMLAAIERITELLASHFPSEGARTNELPDAPLILGG